MVLFHADDYGVNPKQAKRILACSQKGCLNSVSIMPNSDYLQQCMEQLHSDQKIFYAVHINLAEGKCLADRRKLSLLVDRNGVFRQSFVSLLILSFLKRKKLQKQVQIECMAQIQEILKYADANDKLRLDSHVHYHMIPAVFQGLCHACHALGIEADAIRWPVEPLSPLVWNWKVIRQVHINGFLKNMILRICAVMDYPMMLKMGWKRKRAVFFGILFSGNMNWQIVQQLLPKYEAYAAKRRKNLEVLFHPGYIPQGGQLQDEKFAEFYHSKNRKAEEHALLKLRPGRERLC